MSSKSEKVSAMIVHCQGQGIDPHYAGFFDYFNRGLFYESHDVLEQLWLAQRSGPNYSFYKGLIQLAGAFVHLQKNRLRPAAALFKLAHANLLKYPAIHEKLDLGGVICVIDHWLGRLEQTQFSHNPLHTESPPHLHLTN